MIASLLMWLAVFAAAGVVVGLLGRVQSRAFRWVIAAVLWPAAFVGMLYVDVNIPFSESHFDSGAPAPLWIALLATFARLAALASLCLASPLPQRRPDET
ncbi:MAG TPA: hypothetical protein VGD45_08510 [Steroidobacter sp.]|uniref:hypothetical protein n=1 Tax=Steroidobacter sp. TaxID=1978227 RepID=UPI002ED77580